MEIPSRHRQPLRYRHCDFTWMEGANRCPGGNNMRAIMRQRGGLVLVLPLLCGSFSSTAAANSLFRFYFEYGPPSYYFYPPQYVYYYPPRRYMYYYPHYYYSHRYYYPHRY